MFPEYKKYSILPESKDTITSFNAIPMSQELVDENNYPLFEGVINLAKDLAKEKQNNQPMKTAMQILNDEIKSKIIPLSKENGNLTDYQYGHNVAYGVVLTLIEYLLEKEKEQILDFTRRAVRKILDEDRSNPFNLEEYYNETYNK